MPEIILKKNKEALNVFGNRKSKLENDNVGYLLIAPFYVFTVIFILLPILMNIALSFTNYDLLSMSFIGFRNYKNLFGDEYFIISLKNTFVYTGVTLAFLMVLGLAIAIILKKSIFGLKFFRTSFYIPYITSMVAISMIWLWMYEPSHGIFNVLLGFFGIKGKLWLYDANTALGSIIVMSIWKSVGYNMVIYLAGLNAIPGYLYEAAAIDGANSFKQFIHITLPMLSPVTFFLIITGLINNFKVFEQVNIMTNGGPMNATTTIVHQIYNRAFQEFRMGYAASMAIFLLFIVAIITIISFRFGNQGQDHDIG